MGFLQLAKQRYSVRKYQASEVEEAKLNLILEAGRVAPTAANMQPLHLIVVRKEDLTKLKKAANVYNAPLAIIVCGDHTKAWRRPLDGKNTVDIDTSIVTDHMMLQATELGLGTIWVGYFKPDVIREEFGLPEHLEPVNILGIGYGEGDSPSPDRHDQQRKPLMEFVTYA